MLCVGGGWWRWVGGVGGERESIDEEWVWTVVLAEMKGVQGVLPKFFSKPETERLPRSS